MHAQIAHPLHALTRKGALFRWTAECETAFDTLRAKLLTAPVLGYPDFNRDFTLETDASKVGLRATYIITIPGGSKATSSSICQSVYLHLLLKPIMR